MTRLRYALLVASLLALGTGSCRQLAVCDGEPGSCLLLRVNGDGTYANLRSVATLRTGGATPMRIGSSLGAATLPVLLKIVPPDNIAASDITQLRIEALDEGSVSQASGLLTPMWENGSHVEREVTVTLDPIISSVSPAKSPSSGNIAVVISGRGFDAEAHVTIADQALSSPQRVSEKELRGTLPASPGKLGAVDLVVRNRDGKTATIPFSYYASTLDFYAMKAVATRDYDDRIEYPPTTGPDTTPGAVQPMAVGDFDGDGKQDIAAVNWHNISHSVSFLWGDGQGGFPARTDIDIGSTAPLTGLLRPIAILPVKNPITQNTDFMVAFYDSRKFARIPAMASRQTPMLLSAAQVLDSGNPNPISFLATNLDTTPEPEIVLVEYGGGFRYHKYNASGDLAFVGNASTSGNPTQALAVDYSQDGRADIILADYTGNQIKPYLHTGTGSMIQFANGMPWAVGAKPAIAITDFDGDNDPELIVASSNKATIYRLDNNGQQRVIAGPTCAYDIVAPQFLVASEGRLAISGHDYLNILKNPIANLNCIANVPLGTDTRLGSYYPRPLDLVYTPLESNGYPARYYNILSSMLAADVNGDQKQDYLVYLARSGLIQVGLTSNDKIISAENGRSDEFYFVNHADPSEIINPIFDADAGSITTQSDGIKPILAFVTGTGSLGIRPLDATDPLLSPQAYKRYLDPASMAATRSSSVKLADIDGDGQMDVATAITTASGGMYKSAAKVFWSIQLGNAFQAETAPLPVDGDKVASVEADGDGRLAVGDLDRDGAQDLVVASADRKQLSLLYQSPTQKRSFATAIDLALAPTLRSAPLAVGDLDGDGFADVVVGNKNNGVSVLCGNQARTHSLLDATLATAGTTVTHIALADMDDDAAHDLDVVLTLESGEILILLNPGTPQKKRTCGEAPSWMTTPQNQERLKLAATNNALRLWEQLLLADLNNDGLPEIVVSQKAGPLSVFQSASADARSYSQRLLLQNSSYVHARTVAVDQNRDGLLDLYTTRTYGLTFFRNTSR